MGEQDVVPRDAATVILLRDEADGFSIFMVKRHPKSGFMAGAYVFPGGALDEGDRTASLLARVVGRGREEAAKLLHEDDAERALALHVAAIREVFEEAGVLLSADDPVSSLAEARQRLLANVASFGDLLASLDARIDAGALVPFSRWVTPEIEKRRFDARFFIARAPASQEAVHDRIEVTEGEWLRPADALARGARGEIALAPPTLRTLEQLSTLGSVDAAIAYARSRPPPLVRPCFRDFGSSWALTLPGDPEHPERERVLEGPTRFVVVDGVFRSVDPP